MTHKVAIITGAGSGIGRAVAIALAREGYRVALAGRRRSELEGTAALAPAGSCLVQPTDVADPRAVEVLFSAVREQLGRLDLLFNNAGFGARAVPLEELGPDEWRSVVDVNLNGTFYCTQQAFKLILQDANVKAILVNIFGGIVRCDLIAEGVVGAAAELGLSVPLVVRLQGTNAELGRKILADSGLDITPAETLEDAGRKAVAAASGRKG